MPNLNSQDFALTGDDPVKGGAFHYLIDYETGIINWSARVKAGRFLFTKTFAFSGAYRVNPQVLLSEGKTIGSIFSVGDVNVMIMSMDEHVAVCHASVKVNGNVLSGIARLDLSGNFLNLISLSANAIFQGSRVTFKLSEAL